LPVSENAGRLARDACLSRLRGHAILLSAIVHSFHHRKGSKESMNVLTTCLIACSMLLFPGPKPERVTIEELVTAEPVPEGYDLTASELKNGDELLGHQILVTKEGAVSKASVTIETRDLLDKPHKIAALKGYVNGTTKTLANAGLKLVKKHIPDIEKVNVDNRTRCNFIYQRPDGSEIYVHIQVFFTNHGHNVLVITDNKDDFKALGKWADSIEPLKQASKKAK